MKLFLSLLIPLTVGAVSGFFTSEAIPGWYAGIQKPGFNPPNGLFGPVWTVLYLLMGIGFYLIWSLPVNTAGRTTAMSVYGLQLFLNFWWSFLFFKLHRPGWAFAEILLIWLCIIAMIISFYKVRPLAAWLQIPYLLWVGFASVLNYSIWQLNR